MTAKPLPDKITEFSNSTLLIEWNDGHESIYLYDDLRQQCPCATCRRLRSKSRTGKLPFKKRIAPGSADAGIRPAKISRVGLYALQFEWNDKHDTGIYTFEFLRRQCPCEKCETGNK